MILDSGRNMRRTMELISMFDSDTLASQRVRLFETSHGRPSDLAKELEGIMKAVSLGGKSSTIQFLPVDRINTLVAIAPNPGVFDEVEKWLKKLDVQQKVTAGSIDNYVYRVKYGRAEMLAAAIMQLYGGGGFGMGGYGHGRVRRHGRLWHGWIRRHGRRRLWHGWIWRHGWRRLRHGRLRRHGWRRLRHGRLRRHGRRRLRLGGYGGMGGGGYGPGGYGNIGTTSNIPIPYTGAAPGTTAGGAMTGTPGMDQTGSYLGYSGLGTMGRIPRVVPNPMDNTLLIQGTPQEYEQILKLVTMLDVAPRQVLIEAKIYEVTLTGAFASGVAAYLQKAGLGIRGGPSLAARQLLGNASAGGINLTAGALVGQSRELLAFMTAQETSAAHQGDLGAQHHRHRQHCRLD